MGEAQRRKAEISMIKRKYADWFETLTQTEREVATVAKHTHERIVEGKKLFGGCYLLTFFMHQYLKHEKGIETNAVVGWVKRVVQVATHKAEGCARVTPHRTELMNQQVTFANFKVYGKTLGRKIIGHVPDSLGFSVHASNA